MGRQPQPSCWGLLVFPLTRRRLKPRCGRELCRTCSEPGQTSPVARDRHQPTHVRGITSLQNGGLAPPSASGHRLLLFSNPPRHWRVCVRASLCHGSVLSHQKAKLSPLHYTRAQLRVLTSRRGHPHPSAFIPYRGATVCSHLHSFSQTDFCFANPARRASAGFIFFRMCLDSKALSMEADVQPKPRDSKRAGELHSHLE